MNRGAIDRGLFVVTSYRTLVEEEKKQGTYNYEKICLPPYNKRKKDANYSFLDERGIVRTRNNGKCVYVEKGDVIIGKILTKSNKNGEEEIFDCSYVIKSGEEGFVDSVFETDTPNGYKMIKVKIRNQRIPEIGDKHACYTDEHDVLTSTGWKSIANITLEDKVACLVDGDTLQYHHPSEIQKYDYSGEMYNVESSDVSLCVTPNHRMYTSSAGSKCYEIKEARQIYTKQRQYKNNVANWKPENQNRFFVLPAYNNLPDLELDLESWCLLFGILMVEGYSSYYESNDIQIRCVCVPIVNNKIRTILETISAKLDLHSMFNYKNQNLTLWCSNDIRLINYLYDVSMKNHKLPEWCFELDLTHSLILINGLCLRDNRFNIQNKQLRDDFQRLCLHSGLQCECVTTNGFDWVFTIFKTNHNILVNSCNQQNDFYSDFDGVVYCCTVPSGIIYVRKNGKSVWCGQSQNAQKGTVGLLVRQEDMPFTKDGITPDILINAHCIPSRMTIGQLLMSTLGKACCFEGTFADATPFCKNSKDVANTICERLALWGYERHGYEAMYNGMTGELIEAEIMIGPTYYQRLKHMVSDKMHSRHSGHVTMLTHQPLEGRSREGGLRYGEMERDNSIGQGTSVFLNERLFVKSDYYQTTICSGCGNFSTTSTHCKACDTDKIVKVNLPFASKLLFQQLMAMSLKLSMKS